MTTPSSRSTWRRFASSADAWLGALAIGALGLIGINLYVWRGMAVLVGPNSSSNGLATDRAASTPQMVKTLQAADARGTFAKVVSVSASASAIPEQADGASPVASASTDAEARNLTLKQFDAFVDSPGRDEATAKASRFFSRGTTADRSLALLLNAQVSSDSAPGNTPGNIEPLKAEAYRLFAEDAESGLASLHRLSQILDGSPEAVSIREVMRQCTRVLGASPAINTAEERQQLAEIESSLADHR